jgi:hypothetical protein
MKKLAGIHRRSAVAYVAATGLSLGTKCGVSHAQTRAQESLYLVQGVTFVGTQEQQRSAAPFILKLNRDEGFRRAMSSRLSAAVSSLRIKSGHRIDQDNLASVQGDTYAISFAVSGERVDVERLDGTQFNVQYRVRALVLVMNLSVKSENRRIVAVHTVPVTYLTVSDRPPSSTQRLEMFRRLYLAPPADADVVGAWLKEAESLDLREGNVWVRVEPFSIQPKASRMMGEAGISPAELSQMSRRFTSDAEDGISRGFRIPVIPSVAGDTLEAALFTFQDPATAQQIFGGSGGGLAQATFAFPEPSWIVELSAKDYRYVRGKGTTPGGNPIDVIDVALALDIHLRAASPSHPIQPLRTTFFKQERKGIVNDPSRIVPPAADTSRLGERLMKETFEFMTKPSDADPWLKGAHLFPERTAEVKALMQRFAQQFSTRR